MKVGSGNRTYQLVEGWGRLPEGWEFFDVAGVAVDSQDRVFVLNRGGHPVIIFDRDGSFLASWGEGVFTGLHGICIGPDDSVYCVDVRDHTVLKFTPDGKLLMTLGTKGQRSDSGSDGDFRKVKRGAPPFNRPTMVALSPAGDIYVTDGYSNARVHKFAPDGRLLLSWGEPGSMPGQFNVPHGVAVSRAGTVYVGDRENQRVQVFSPTGEFLAEWRGIYRPNDLHIDIAGNVYVAELGCRVGLTSMGFPEATPESPGGGVSVFDLEGNPLARWGEPGCPVPGSFLAPHAVCTDSQDDLYVGEVVGGISGGQPPAGCRALSKFARVG